MTTPLYDPADERDACGIGFVADAAGRSSRSIVDAALGALCAVRHRGAVAADSKTGDGAGVLLPIPRLVAGVTGDGGVAMVFLDEAEPAPGRWALEDACEREGVPVVGWRAVPVDRAALGEGARRSAPLIEQALLGAPRDSAPREPAAFRARRRAEQQARRAGLSLYIASMSFKTVTYKALCAADQLATFYPDLADDRCEAWFTLFHQRYATNTVPTWERAQPFRYLAHNGEINTIAGNTAWMNARAGTLGGDLGAGGDEDDLLTPVVHADNSDSGILDEALEVLRRGGRELPHAAATLVPPSLPGLGSSDVAALFRYESCLMEPWDGPAALVMTDGDCVAATLDRNGLRPLRIAVCDDGFVACCTEAGAVDTKGRGLVRRLKLGPGRSLCVDPGRGGVLEDASVKERMARRHPYRKWLVDHLVTSPAGAPLEAAPEGTTARQVAAGYTKEEFTVVLRPMGTAGAEPISSMGDDTAQPPLASHARPPFSFLKQRFAQVTNPPIDHLRERHVMSLTTLVGRRSPLLDERPEAAALRHYDSFLLFPSAVDDLVAAGARVLDATFSVAAGPAGLEAACAALSGEAAEAVASGVSCLIVSDFAGSPGRAAVPSVLAAGAVHHRLVAARLRTQTGIVVVADDVRETHHAACLLSNGTDAVCPRLALESLVELASTGRLGGGVGAEQAQRNFVAALEDGVLKVMSKMGIATLDSYRGAQIIEAVGLGPDVIELCLPAVSSVLGGLSLSDIGAGVLARHETAYRAPKPQLANPGYVKFKRGGEYHATNPDVVEGLHAAVGIADDATEEPDEMAAAHALRRAAAGDAAAYRRFSRLVDERPPAEPRDLLEVITPDTPVSLEEVEPAEEIVRRFSTGAMSHGALSSEAHETLSVALNLVRGMANTGEGGEAPERFRDERNSGIKQVASGRFGVTPEYLAYAGELQIKMAQGSKPGEGGQLPGVKVTVDIARLRHTVPGVSLISPPPHHDIYSIEDLAQLIYDLKQANEHAAVSVKLVASQGIGTIAAGVVKGLADVVHISGADGGTGASPLSSIKNAGLPWEVGLAETQAALVANGLRSRVRLRVDGGLKTGRDVVVAALMGADEFSFGTAVLVAEGCILVRTCHRDTCPVGIATQNPKLRAKFAGTPEMVVHYLMFVAEEVRALLAALGVRRLEDAVGRVDFLRQRATGRSAAGGLDLAPLLATPGEGDMRFRGATPLQAPRSVLGDRLRDDALPALREGHIADLHYPITTADRSVGARLGCSLAYDIGMARPPGRACVTFSGSAGQSFGAFLTEGIELNLVGEANDYVCKGMGGGRVAISPPPDDAGDPYLAGNTVLYGATGGRLFIAGRVGERFGVRNSGAVAVIEGAGDHACEYMTAGAVVILGPTGINLGAGMSGGEAYVYDPEDVAGDRINPQLVGLYEPTNGQLESLRRVIGKHVEATGSARGRRILESWDTTSSSFRRVAPLAEVARLEALFQGPGSDDEEDAA